MGPRLDAPSRRRRLVQTGEPGCGGRPRSRSRASWRRSPRRLPGPCPHGRPRRRPVRCWPRWIWGPATGGGDRQSFPAGNGNGAQLARALAVKPWFLLADEPASSLDPVRRTLMLELFERVRRTRGVGRVDRRPRPRHARGTLRSGARDAGRGWWWSATALARTPGPGIPAAQGPGRGGACTPAARRPGWRAARWGGRGRAVSASAGPRWRLPVRSRLSPG